MQQQSPHITNSGPPAPVDLISTEQIQKYLDDNKKLIMAILENENLGKTAESAQYQASLQKNLLYLAAIADAQAQGTTGTSQSSQGSSNLLQVQAPSIQQPPGVPVTKLSFQLNDARHQDQLFRQQQQQVNVNFTAAQQMQSTGLSNSFGSLTDFRSGSQGSWFEASSGDAQQQLGSGPIHGRELYQDG